MVELCMNKIIKKEKKMEFKYIIQMMDLQKVNNIIKMENL